MNKIITCEECGIDYYSETIVPRQSFRHVFPDIVKLETELAEARDEIENKQYSLVCDSERIQLLCEHVDELRAEIEHKGSLIEQMREALKLALAECWSTCCENEIRAALSAAERGE